MCVCVRVCVWVCVYVCMYLCVCMYVYNRSMLYTKIEFNIALDIARLILYRPLL